MRTNQHRCRAQGMRLVYGSAFLCVAFASAQAQSDSTRTDSSGSREWWHRASRAAGLRLTSGITYNRVEGLPILIGPTVRDSVGSAALNLDILGIFRTAHSFRWDAGNIGHRVTAEIRQGDADGRGYGLAVSSFDIVDPIEPWQMGSSESGLASFFLHRDYRDYFGRHGASLTGSFYTGQRSSISVELNDERWAPREARDVFSVWNNGASWRANPEVDAGRFHRGILAARLDSRNNEIAPATGWLILADYELGRGHVTHFGAPSGAAPALTTTRASYGRGFLDARAYNRISPATQLNLRVVLGGWLHGDRLPLERRLSVGGAGTIPGFDFRAVKLSGIESGQCNTALPVPRGNPAQCDRVALMQAEYRSELHPHFLDVVNSRAIRLRPIGFTVRPIAVAFVDAGRGWLVGRRAGDLTYPSASIPSLATFKTDIGLGVDFGLFGLYVAKAVSDENEPANLIIRLRRRF